jgi:DNA repair protein SbcC/Rad50
MMRPLRLFLDGFGSYRQPTEADFSDVNFFALTGPTGSGKSTLIDGLCFALYGTVPRWGKENVIAHALAPAASACRVGLVFEAGGKRYAAVRALARDKRGQVHTREARLDLLDPAVPPDAPIADLLGASVEHLAEGPDPVKAKVQDILGLGYEHFIQSVLLPQGRFADFLQAEPRKRQELLVELLAFGVYKKIGQQARDRARLAAERTRLALEQRAKLTDATAEAEERAVARVRDLEALGQAVEGQLRALDQRAEQARQAAEQADAVRTQAGLLAAVRVPAGVAGLTDRITATDQLVAAREKQAADAASAEEEAERARDTLPDKVHLEALARGYEQQHTLTTRLQAQQEALTAGRDAEHTLALELEAAEREAEHARAAREAAQQADRAHALAEGLRLGEPCPVCLQPVTTLPHHATPAGLDEAGAAVDVAKKKLTQARNAHGEASKLVAAAEATVDYTRQGLDDVAATLAAAPAESEVASTLEAIAKADQALGRAREAVRTHRQELAAAKKDREDLAEDESRAWADLRRARDSVVGLGAPVVQEGDLAAAWGALATWAAQQHAERSQHLPDLEAAASALRQEIAVGTAALLGLLSEHGITGVTDPAKAPGEVALNRARAEANLDRVRRDREQAARLDDQIRAHCEDEQVASELGRLLRSDRFERWLCGEALDSLVAEASVTLMELSGGQYELDRDDRNDLVVIDYQDAAAIRPVNTLSGGETFQASLALALALSRQVVQLSAGVRDLNSMFLDEGFGSLDPETLDTVATTLERLAADKDRMVGLVTHVAALAERVPFRFVVSRDGATSVLRREGT